MKRIDRIRFHLLWKWRTFCDKFWFWLARRVPKKLAYWCAIVVGAHATTGKHSAQIVPDLTLIQALERWSLK